MAQQRGETELGHQRHGELIESVGENHHLEALTQPIEEFTRTRQRVQLTDNFLNLRKTVAVLVENLQALGHQHVVIRNIPCGRLELFDAGFFGECDPDFRNQYSFKVKACEFHSGLLINS